MDTGILSKWRGNFFKSIVIQHTPSYNVLKNTKMQQVMNPVIDLLQSHRSIRKFTEEPITSHDLEQICLSASAAATSSHLQCVSIIRVTDVAKRETLVHLTGEQPYVRSCAEFLVFCIDYHRHQQICPEGKFGYTEQVLLGSVDAALMGQNALIAAQSLGMGGVFIGGIRNHPEEVVSLLQLPKHVFPLFGLCLGWPAQDPALKPRLPLSLLLHENRYEPISAEKEAILAAYDQQVAGYYRERSQGKTSHTWSETISEKLSKESRPFMLNSLHKQGFAEH